MERTSSLAVILTVVLSAALAACSGPAPQAASAPPPPAAEAESTVPPPPPPPPPPAPELPRGGTTLFPDYRVVAFYGGADTEALGVLGEGSPETAARRLARAAQPFARPDRPVLPAFELIATIAQSSPGEDGDYSTYSGAAAVQEYLDAARAARALLVIDIQPGRADFLEEVKRYERFLLEPDVGLALDPEWSMRAGEVPAEQIGSTDAETINEVSAYLAELVERRRLPQKLLVIHQFTPDMVENKEQVVPRDGLAITYHIDGFGGQEAKLGKYRELHSRDPRFANGFKLFYDEDTDMLTPAETLRLRPAPDLITYQ